ncbi:hypothetical protein [Streptomyces griseus]|uniref:hypothetical protein n=1 Tax=Streptomyces griseus TaxID=1911 RepID=UPI0036A53C3B
MGHAPENYQDVDLLPYEDTALAFLEGHLVRARHHTRLLDHEKDAIRARGLRLLDAQLVNDRLEQAHQLGYLTEAEHETLRTVNETVPDQRVPGRREDQVCLTLSAATQLHHIHGVHRLLTYWGGEAIYWQHCEGSPALATKLRSLGVPSVVTALLVQGAASETEKALAYERIRKIRRQVGSAVRIPQQSELAITRMARPSLTAAVDAARP